MKQLQLAAYASGNGLNLRLSLMLFLYALQGMLKFWDVRMDTCLEELSVLNDPAKHAISHIHASPASDGGDDGRFLGVNSYDNVLRVYDRRSKLISSRGLQRGAGGGNDARDDQLQLVRSVTGHKNKTGLSRAHSSVAMATSTS